MGRMDAATTPAKGINARRTPMRALSSPRSFKKKMNAGPKMVNDVKAVLNNVATTYHGRRPYFLIEIMHILVRSNRLRSTLNVKSQLSTCILRDEKAFIDILGLRIPAGFFVSPVPY